MAAQDSLRMVLIRAVGWNGSTSQAAAGRVAGPHPLDQCPDRAQTDNLD